MGRWTPGRLAGLRPLRGRRCAASPRSFLSARFSSNASRMPTLQEPGCGGRHAFCTHPRPFLPEATAVSAKVEPGSLCSVDILQREKSSLTTAKPFSLSPFELCSTRKTRASPLTRMTGFGPVREGRTTSTWMGTSTGGHVGVTMKAPNTLMSRVIPSPCRRSCCELSQENRAGASNR
jgi:hypothetical protein